MIDKDKIIVKLYLKTEDQAEALVSLQKQYDEVKAENAKLRGQHAQVLAKESAQNTLKADLDMLRSQVSQLKSQNGELERALKSARGGRKKKKTEVLKIEQNPILEFFMAQKFELKPKINNSYQASELLKRFNEWAKEVEEQTFNAAQFGRRLRDYGLDKQHTRSGIKWAVTPKFLDKLNEYEFNTQEFNAHFERCVIAYFKYLNELGTDDRLFYGKKYNNNDIINMFRDIKRYFKNESFFEQITKNDFQKCLLNIGFAHDIDWVVTKEAMQRIRPN